MANSTETPLPKPEMLVVLENANTAHKAGDYANALRFYETFFDHALDDDPYALYGVRLSHCLESWAELALIFPGAKRALESKQRDVLAVYEQQKDPEKFHDYLCICRQLGLNDKALETFLRLHAENPKSSAKLVKYIWDDLINAEHWGVCSALLEQPAQKLDELFSIFDESTKLKEIDSSFDTIQFENHIVDQLLNDVHKISLVLRHTQRSEELVSIERQFYSALENQESSSLHKQAHSKSSFLFSGH